MAQVIVFKNTDDSIGVIHPTPEGVALGMQVLGEKDTPTGLDFWIVEDTVISSDRTDRDKWELDGTEGVKDGVGA